MHIKPTVNPPTGVPPQRLPSLRRHLGGLLATVSLVVFLYVRFTLPLPLYAYESPYGVILLVIGWMLVVSDYLQELMSRRQLLWIGACLFVLGGGISLWR